MCWSVGPGGFEVLAGGHASFPSALVATFPPGSSRQYGLQGIYCFGYVREVAFGTQGLGGFIVENSCAHAVHKPVFLPGFFN